MKKVLMIIIVSLFFAVPNLVIASEGPMNLPEGANPEAVNHNQEGIAHWNQGHYDVALAHFEGAAKADSSIAQIHFNEAICLDKMGKHGEATMHFKAAKKMAKGDEAILNSPILNGHLGH